ncbi:hypothetical protein AUR04nite_09890 [Glutamicibacter uratoxydans]|uniref:Uncharacterized protein n=1 Tax=Glutamicibacter uratoxydans TaxID=43667 RepID=A0A4Y4DLG2_GLUUR|nr:hypothetical protein [Glutamicibacter uratoxydans]GED05457.1 hypothetical protein AUR04nite_09890 [Glutamicibacter uratoxydans]
MASDDPALVPEDLSRPVQFTDVRDLAGAVVAGELPPVLDAAGPMMSFEQFLHAAAQVAVFDGVLRPASDRCLLEHGVTYWSGERSLPLWLPEVDQNMLNRAGKLFTTTLHSMDQTLSAVLEDERLHSLRRKRRAGLSHEFERSLIEQLGHK